MQSCLTCRRWVTSNNFTMSVGELGAGIWIQNENVKGERFKK
jgi:hypothetical protein